MTSPNWPYQLVSGICVAGALGIFAAVFSDAMRKTPIAIDSSVKSYTQQQQIQADTERLQQEQLLAKQQASAQMQQQQTQAQLEQQRIQQQYELEKLAQQKPLTVPQHSAVNSSVQCLPNTNAVNMRSQPAGDIRYQLACGEPIWATDTTVMQNGVVWRLVYRGGLPGWIADQLIQQGGNQP